MSRFPREYAESTLKRRYNKLELAQYLVELLQCYFEALVNLNENITFDCKAFAGIGGFTKRNTVKETKTGKLLNDLATYLRGFNKSFRDYDACVFVVLDNDDNDVGEFRFSLEKVSEDNKITIDHVFCIAVEEVEAWLLGDRDAILKAYPQAKVNVLNTYMQDSICGTWEKLADAVYPNGSRVLKKQTYRERGSIKCEWAANIGKYMTLDGNKSPSFNYFINQVMERI